jgi:hypothetical protein
MTSVKFKFLAYFETRDDEKSYISWRITNGIKHFFHASDRLNMWPRNCRITVLCSQDRVELIKKSSWYRAEWDTHLFD